MKLNSNVRLRIVTLAITTLLTTSIGGFIAFQEYRSATSAIDIAINSTIADAAQSPHQELSAALFHIEEYSLDVSLYLLARDGSMTSVNESTLHLMNDISLSDAARAITHVQSAVSQGDYRYRSLLISGGDYLVVAAASDAVVKNFYSNLISVAITTAILSFLAFLVLTFYIRRLKRSDDADALARMQTFLGDASHELRTPLTVIKGYVEMLSKGQLTAEQDQERAFTRVNTEIGRMENLIHDLLLLAELGESGQRSAENLNISEVLTSHTQDFIILNPKRNVTLDIPDDLHVDIARDHLVRFIQNALNNISRHTGDGDPVAIRLSQRGKNLLLIIEDGGPGLPESAYRAKVKSLTRFDQSRSRESGGSGLGMSIMAGVIAKAGGELTLAKSALGGLAIIASLPIHRE